MLADLLTGPAREPYTTTGRLGLAFALYQVLGVGLAVRAWRHPNLDHRSRRAWGVMAVAYLLLGASGALRPSYPAGVDFPSPADVLRLAFVPVMLLGLLMLPLRTQGRRERHKVWLDSVVVVVAGAMVLWYLEIGTGAEPPGRITGGAAVAAIAYPLLDLALIFGASVVLFRGATESARRPAGLLAVAMLIIAAGDAYLGHRQSTVGASPPDRWQYACWVTGHFVITMAAFVQCRLASRRGVHGTTSGDRPMSVLPYLAVALSYLLLAVAVGARDPRLLGLVGGAAVITGVVVARQIIAVRQNHELANTDALTGLVNRRQLYARLRLALARGGQHVAVLLVDIDGFKDVNDTMGHEAGDQLLIAVGRILRRNVLGADVVARLGGDEFAVVLHNLGSPGDAAAVARRIIADMQTPVTIGDTLVQPHATIGVAVGAPGRLTAEELLDDADLAMRRARRDPTAAVATYQDYADESAGPGTTTDGPPDHPDPHRGPHGTE